MKQDLTKLFNSNWFFLTLVGYAFVLPLSPALVSVMGGVVLFTSIVEDSWENKTERFRSNLWMLAIPAIFGIYLFSSLLSGFNNNAIYELKKTMFWFVLPMAFMLGKKLNTKQVRVVFYTFTIAVGISVLVALVRWFILSKAGSFAVHKVGLISHIRFSFQLILAFWFLILVIKENAGKQNIKLTIGFGVASLITVFFLFFQQSLTGIVVFLVSVAFYILHIILSRNKTKAFVNVTVLLIVLILPVFYIYSVVNSFYNIEEIDEETLPRTTKQGNLYSHDVNNPMVENGKYVYLFVCANEMKKEWNKISTLKYDSLGNNGFPVHSTLVRYMTSKGLKKDAEGVKQLTPKDIENIENGMANIVYQKRFSLHPRIYQTVWEYYVYSYTGNPSYQSFSQRIEYAKAAITVIKENIWFGVGTGSSREAFSLAFQKNNSQLNESLYASSHNQYLNYLVKFGLIGFLLILFLLIYPLIKTKAYKNDLFLILLVFMLVANLADSNFESHMGSSFFVFFYCLLCMAGQNDFIGLKKNEKY